MILDAHTVLVNGLNDAGPWLRRFTLGGAPTDVCVGCHPTLVGHEARIDGTESTHTLVRADGERPLPSASVYGLSPRGTVWAFVAMIEVRPYEYERHLHIEGVTPPIDQTLSSTLGDIGQLVLADDGTAVVEAAVHVADALQSCVVILRPTTRVVACEPCDSTAEHCR